MNVILLEPGEVGADGRARLDDVRAHHIRAVLQVGSGGRVRVGIVDGPLGTAHASPAADGSVSLQCEFGGTPPVPAVDLLLALPRPKVLRRLWAQIAALGVARIILTNAARVERNYFDTHVLDARVYRPLLIEGLQQARDTRLPLVSVHRQFRKLVEDDLDGLSDATIRLVADPASKGSLLAAAVSTRLLLAVGPEGGWNRFEMDLLKSRGFAGVGLGSRTLRSDTACIALLALAHEALRLRPGR